MQICIIKFTRTLWFLWIEDLRRRIPQISKRPKAANKNNSKMPTLRHRSTSAATLRRPSSGQRSRGWTMCTGLRVRCALLGSRAHAHSAKSVTPLAHRAGDWQALARESLSLPPEPCWRGRPCSAACLVPFASPVADGVRRLAS